MFMKFIVFIKHLFDFFIMSGKETKFCLGIIKIKSFLYNPNILKHLLILKNGKCYFVSYPYLFWFNSKETNVVKNTAKSDSLLIRFN